MNVFQAAHQLGKRVVLTAPVGPFPKGRSGQLVSIQAGLDAGGRTVSEPYATVAFEIGDFWEENVPLCALRSLQFQR
jgi:hypothetical protein